MFELTLLVKYNLVLFVAFLPFSGMFFKDKSFSVNESSTQIKILSLAFLLAIIGGLRGQNEGIDFPVYLEFYNYILAHNEFSWHLKRNEIGWDYLNYAFASAGVPASVFFGAIAGTIALLFLKGSYRFHFLVPLMLFFFFATGYYFSTYNTIRQWLAVAIFFYSIRYIIEGKLVLYLLCIGLATLIHVSAVVLFPLYLLRFVAYDRLYFGAGYLASLFFLFSGLTPSVLLDIALNAISEIDLFSKYNWYNEHGAFDGKSALVSSGLGVVLRVITNFYLLYMSEQVLRKRPDLKIYFIIYFIGEIVGSIFFDYHILSRILSYFKICLCIVFAGSVYYSMRKHQREIAVVFVVGYFFVFNYMVSKAFWVTV